MFKAVSFWTGLLADLALGQAALEDRALLAALNDNFNRMVDAGMFTGEAPAFDDIVDRLRVLETAINGC